MAKYYDIPDTMKYVVEVPEDLKGRVIGRGGRQLKAIESETGVKMQMVSVGAILEGSEEAIESAKEWIQYIITGNVPRYTDTMKYVVEVPEDQKGRVIGRGGRQMKAIESETGVKMQMVSVGAILEGSEEAIEKAKEMIQSIITGKVTRYTDTMKYIVEVPEDLKGLVIGKRGGQLKAIESETGVKMEMEPSGAALEGSEEAIEKAKEMIQSIIRSCTCSGISKKTIDFPLEYYGIVMGTNGVMIKSIKRQTNTEIRLENGDGTGLAHINGATEEDCNKAEQKILEIVSSPLFKKLAFVDGAYVGEDNEFELEIYKDDSIDKLMYKLIMHGDKCLAMKPKEIEYLPLVEKSLLEVLHKIHKENEESKNLFTDMWCHFGHAYIYNVDKDDVGKFYEIEAVNENLQKEDYKWRAHFTDGLETPELNELEGFLSKRPYKVQPNIRYDYTFLCPSGRRVQTFARLSSSNADGISFQNLSTEAVKYQLLALNVRLKVDIFNPYLNVDCHLVVRTALKETSSVRDEEDDQILIDFLNDNFRLKEGKLEVQGDLPDGFTMTYKRVCKRRRYPYTSNNVHFNVIISEEESQKLAPEKNVRAKTDIYLDCIEWNQLLDQEDWEPEAIVSKLPDFLRFIRDVQRNIK